MEYLNNSIRDTLNVEVVRANTMEAIIRAKMKKRIFDTVSNVLKKFEGKQINNRLVTAVKKELPDNVVSLECTGSSHYNLYIWGNGIGFDQRLMIFICYTGTNPTTNRNYAVDFGYDYWLKNAGTHSHHHYDEIIAKYECGLKECDKLVREYNLALERLLKAKVELGVCALTHWE
jgi:hypothetical protein